MQKMIENICYVKEEENKQQELKCLANIKRIIDRVEAELKRSWQLEDRLLLQKS